VSRHRALTDPQRRARPSSPETAETVAQAPAPLGMLVHEEVDDSSKKKGRPGRTAAGQSS